MTEDKWIYIYNPYNKRYRYVLGTKGNNTLFCLGINPSTAEPNALDPTLKRVEGIASSMNYDSYIMLNVYPQRDANPDNLSQTQNRTEHRNNLRAIVTIISQYLENHESIDLWLAFGDHIYDRAYLPLCLKDIYKSLQNRKIRWFVTDTNKTGTPKHPLYEKKTSTLFGFDMASFIEKLM